MLKLPNGKISPMVTLGMSAVLVANNICPIAIYLTIYDICKLEFNDQLEL